MRVDLSRLVRAEQCSEMAACLASELDAEIVKLRAEIARLRAELNKQGRAWREQRRDLVSQLQAERRRGAELLRTTSALPKEDT